MLSNNEDKILIYKKYSCITIFDISIWHRSRYIWHINGVVSMSLIHWHNFQPKMCTLFSKVNFRTFRKKVKWKRIFSNPFHEPSLMITLWQVLHNRPCSTQSILFVHTRTNRDLINLKEQIHFVISEKRIWQIITYLMMNCKYFPSCIW